MDLQVRVNKKKYSSVCTPPSMLQVTVTAACSGRALCRYNRIVVNGTDISNVQLFLGLRCLGHILKVPVVDFAGDHMDQNAVCI